MTPELREACVRAVHTIAPDGKTARAGRAALHILAELGHPTLARVLSFPPFVWAIELGYFLVAHNRGFFGRFLFTRE